MGIGLYLHQTTRSKQLINMLDSCTNYDKVLDIKKGVASAIPEKRSENNGVFIPSCLIESSRPFFAIDNTDIKIDTPTGKHQLHGTTLYFNKIRNQRQNLLCVFKGDQNVIGQTLHFMKKQTFPNLPRKML